ncbi:MAG: 3-isopropylmalate dehydrogenase [Bernardetiaceae bacterium]|jgi:3-isopropylmalate dehydrogenase|nr:3-isopropylmalate dehydrogenase [Bernardetiaceae bacterium]
MAKKILIIPGDGIGPEVTEWGKQTLETVGQLFGHQFVYDQALLGHAAIEATGQPLPPDTLAKAQQADAILFGAIGHPMYDNDPTRKVRPEQGLLALRKGLGLYCNLRPIKLFDELVHASSLKPEVLRGADILFFRELTGDVYFGEPRGRRDEGDTAFDTMIYSRYEVRRIAERAFQAARHRRRRVHSIDKANVLESSRLWRETVKQVAAQYPDVELIDMFVDNAAMQLIRDPRQFDVVLTGNLFGDILTDEASQIAGSMGMLASASLGDKTGFYEPIHGSAPDIAGRGIANPLASILSVALLLEHAFGLVAEAQAVVRAVETTLAQGWRTGDIADAQTPAAQRLNTAQMGQKVLAALAVPETA